MFEFIFFKESESIILSSLFSDFSLLLLFESASSFINVDSLIIKLSILKSNFSLSLNIIEIILFSILYLIPSSFLIELMLIFFHNSEVINLYLLFFRLSFKFSFFSNFVCET